MIKKYILLLCLSLLTLLSSLLSADDNIIKKHPTGLRKLTPREQSYISKRIHPLTKPEPNRLALQRFAEAPGTNEGIAASAINSQFLPPVGDQGNLSSCAAWASCYYVKTYQDAQQRNWSDLATNLAHQMSPAFGYNLANGGVDDGSDPGFIMQLMCDHGCTTMADMFVSSVSTDVITWPTAPMWQSAITYRADTASTIDLSVSSGITALKQWIANGNVAVIGIEAYENLEYYHNPFLRRAVTISTNSVLYANSGIDEGGHAMTVIGYDDTISFTTGSGQQETGAFLLVNSWGTDWGITEPRTGIATAGFIWISYDYVQNLSTYKEAYVMTDRSGYTPTTFGTFTLTHPDRGDLDVQFMGG
ncbi:MAG: C1 family peptidase, partial [Endomicrobiales bacterium]